MGMIFCIGLLTVVSWLCFFCSLDFRTLRDHCRAGRATLRSMSDILNSAASLPAFITSQVCLTACLIAPNFFGFCSLFSFTLSISSFWLAMCPKKFRGLHWRQVSDLVVMAAVVDLLVSTKQFCMPKSGLTYPYICLVCSPISHTNHISPTLGVVCRGTYCDVTNQVSQIGHIFSIVKY